MEGDPRIALLTAELRSVRDEFAAQGAALGAALLALHSETRASREELRKLHDEVLPLRELLPERIAAREAARKEALRHNFISALIVTAQNGFGRDV
jgi:hypothetical protein